MTPETLLDPENLPEDLQWLSAEFRLQPNDPVFVLIAWHWQRIQKGEDSLRGATMQLQAAIDTRMESLLGAVETAVAVKEQLAHVQKTLAEKPLALGQRLENDLKAPVAATVKDIAAVQASLSSLLNSVESLLVKTQRRQTLAAFVVGAFVGGVGVAIFR